MFVRESLFIGGEWVGATHGETITVTSPHSEQVVGRVAGASTADIDLAVRRANEAFADRRWSGLPPPQRGAVLERVAEALEARADEVADLISLEMGAPLQSVRHGQVPVAAALLRYYAGLARTFDFEQHRTSGRATSIVMYEPVGVVAAIVPWNAPLLLAVLKLAPALAAGCSVILKPAEESPLDALVLADICSEAGVPDGVLSVVPAGRDPSDHLVRHPGVDKVSFTGSTMVGRQIAAACADTITRVSLELGGKSAAIVLDDAVVESTVAKLVPLVFENTGQSCVAQTRILVPDRLHDQFVDALVAATNQLTVGDPADPSTTLGPLVSDRQRRHVEDYVALGREEGAFVASGGGRPAGLERGWYVEPTVFTGVTNSMRITQEEIFGPVVVVIPYSTLEEAIDIANDSIYGLGGSVWTEDIALGLEVARQVRTGSFRVNGAGHILETPAGGFKQSGQTREFGPEGLLQYLEQKAVAVRLPSPS